MGTLVGEEFLRFIAFDLLVHSWDLAHHARAAVRPPPDLIDDIEAFTHQVLTPAVCDGINFAVAARPPEGSSALERIVALSGRQP